jgi:hypothetical protein
MLRLLALLLLSAHAKDYDADKEIRKAKRARVPSAALVEGFAGQLCILIGTREEAKHAAQ